MLSKSEDIRKQIDFLKRLIDENAPKQTIKLEQKRLNQMLEDYLNIEKNKTLEYGLAGFEKLDAEDKKTIEYLINFFNKSEKR